MTNFGTHISHKRFDQEKLITKGYFSQYALPIQKLKHKNMQLLDNMYLKTIQKH